MGRTVAAFRAKHSRATHSRAERVAKALYSLASSETKCFLAFPCGSLNILGLQCLISMYVLSSTCLNDSELWLPHVIAGLAAGVKEGRSISLKGPDMSQICDV